MLETQTSQTSQTSPVSNTSQVLKTTGSLRRENELGSVTIVTAGILAIIGAITFTVVKMGVAANNRARAQAVADLGALAGASVDLETAQRVVAANGAVMVSASAQGEVVDLGVTVNDSHATARAERRYIPWNPIDLGPGVTDDIETTTIATVAPTTTRALIFETIPTRPSTSRALVFPTIPSVSIKPPIKKPVVTIKPAPVPGTSPRRA